MRARGGFTLIELLVVIAILGILTGIGAINFAAYRQRLRLNEATQRTALMLREAGEEAVANSQGVDLTVKKQELSWTFLGQTSVQGRAALPSGASTALKSGSLIRYSGRGLPLQSYEVTVTLGTLTRRVYLQPTGQVYAP